MLYFWFLLLFMRQVLTRTEAPSGLEFAILLSFQSVVIINTPPSCNVIIKDEDLKVMR